MKSVKFIWDSTTEIDPALKTNVESQVQGVFNDTKVNMVAPCHRGMVTARLAPAGSEQKEVEGQITCSCGNTYCELSSTENGHHLSFVSSLKK